MKLRSLICRSPPAVRPGGWGPLLKREAPRGFPGGAAVKNPPASAGDMGSSPGPGRSHMPQSN